MPGPGGGGRSGGFGGGSRGGGNFGGGHRPGGFGGHRPGGFYRPHRPFFFTPFFGFRRPFYGYGYRSGCLGGALGLMMAPIVILIIIFSLITNIFGAVGRSVSNIASGGQSIYKESAMQDYADMCYAEEFEKGSTYEDNILILFLVNEEYDGYYSIAWVGNNINNNINRMFGNEYTEFGKAITDNIDDSFYKYSLEKSLAMAVDDMSKNVEDLHLKSSFIDKNVSDHIYDSHITNKSSLDITGDTINKSLDNFTEATDIPIVIVVEDIDDVFEKTINTGDVITVILAFGIGGFAVYLIVKSFKEQSNGENHYNNNYYQDNNNNW